MDNRQIRTKTWGEKMAAHGVILWPSVGTFDGRQWGDSHGRRQVEPDLLARSRQVPRPHPSGRGKRVSHDRWDARFDGRVRHRPDACFASPARTAGDAAALVLSPNLERPAAAVRTIAFVFLRPRVARSRWREAVGQTNAVVDFCAFDIRSRFWGEPFRSRRTVSGRLSRSHEVSENGPCEIRTRGLVCPTATRHCDRPDPVLWASRRALAIAQSRASGCRGPHDRFRPPAASRRAIALAT